MGLLSKFNRKTIHIFGTVDILFDLRHQVEVTTSDHGPPDKDCVFWSKNC